MHAIIKEATDFYKSKSSSGTLSADIISDHRFTCIDLEIKTVKFKSKIIQIRNFKHFDRTSYSNDVASMQFDDIYYVDDIDMKVNMLTSFIQSVFDKTTVYK